MRDLIKGARVLLLCENFYDYDIAIKKELIKLGATYVYLKNVKFFNSSFREPTNLKLHGLLLNPFARKKWTNHFIDEIRDMNFDIFLCIENACFSRYFMTFLRKNNPCIKCVLFLWDTYKTQQGGFKDYRFLFDKVYSFDRDDAKKYDIAYYPDFYIPQYDCHESKYDLCFIGTVNESSTFHRFKLLDYIDRFCVQYGLNPFLYLKLSHPYIIPYNPFMYLKDKYYGNKYRDSIIKYQNTSWLYTESIKLEKCNKIQSESKVLLDLSHKNRQGMTINAITAIAHGKKLITTNYHIIDEDFYDPDMVYILDESNPQLDPAFWHRPNKKIDISYLRIDNWIKHIINYE